MKFEVGQVIVTPRASDVLRASGMNMEELLIRHQSGDWGEVSEQVRQINEMGLTRALNLQSTYVTTTGERVAVMTKADRSLTLVHVDVAMHAVRT